MSTKYTKEEALEYHHNGKIEVCVKKPVATAKDLTLAYSPGVAEPCKEIARDRELAYKYTNKSNLVAVISDGSAVLGLGNIGGHASKPVMEGKAVLFKKFAGVDAFDIELNESDPEKIVEICKAISPTFGGINLEDIKAPKCFEIEKRLKAETNIPVMHDDQHGTAIITTAGLMNAIELSGKNKEDIKIIVNGSGAAGIACARMYRAFGIKNIILIDSKGVIHSERTDLTPEKIEFAIKTKDRILEDVIKDADMFLGLSRAGVLTKDMVKQMAPNPIIFALANPEPEIYPEDIEKVRDDAMIGTGRSDYPNQVNNVLGFPYIFRGALDVRARAITENMKIAAAKALADLAKEPITQEVKDIIGSDDIKFGKYYIIPNPFDRRVFVAVSSAVAKAAFDDGVARVKDFDVEEYKKHLEKQL
ncbi:malate oxidoreductase [Campylobacter blaseri]|uniref:Malate dehydrogenase n=1 Tax=Campylobacter blaseri TaxID=2042961 RepID=A0A2P8R420_9BACT|nr:malic enzyme-like NAD(P)-binding protein [Campylobacter blaseri]PSM53246.1 malate dehydrogenase [Campylobacter blaseri]PSM54712.1 malate dehydrogenase [Campylobacter blaseri]QKF86804.1 malate oxidoreductase [Campylobacter blaseri]